MLNSMSLIEVTDELRTTKQYQLLWEAINALLFACETTDTSGDFKRQLIIEQTKKQIDYTLATHFSTKP